MVSIVSHVMVGHDGLVIAIDGTSGSGKSSVSRGVAVRLGLRYLDTGAMYRAGTWWMLTNGVDVTDSAAISDGAWAFTLASTTDPVAPGILVNGTDVSDAIRQADVTGAVSAVSAVPAIRERMVAAQRVAVQQACATSKGVVVEGRDIATVVLPNADVKIFLTADAAARAARRAAQDSSEGRAAHLDTVEASLTARDKADSARAVSPLTKAPDAVVVDATHLSLAEVIDTVVDLVVTYDPNAVRLLGGDDAC